MNNRVRSVIWLGVVLAALLPATVALMQEGSAAQDFAVPNTTDYLLLGLAVVALIIGIWTVRLIVRFRTLRKDEATLEALEGESETAQ